MTFISYRHTDADDHADRLIDRLHHCYSTATTTLYLRIAGTP